MQHKFAIALSAAGLSWLLATAAHAGVFLSFTAGQPQYDAQPAAAVAVKVYLQETLTEGESSIIATQGGLFSAGLKIVPQSPLPTDPASIASLADIAPNLEFSGGSIENLSPLTLLLADGILAEPGPMGDVLPDGSRRILLGTFNFKAGSVLGETTSFKITDYDDHGISSDTLTWGGTVLDERISPALFNISVVPEPSFLLPLSILAVLIRRRKVREPAI